MFEIRSSSLLKVEIILALFLYFLGIVGSYLRYKKYQRYGRLDTLCMICFTWAGNLMMLGLLNLLKFSFIPTLHLQVGRIIYYSGSVASSFIFLSKKYEEAKFANQIAMSILLSGLAFILGEALLFYYHLPFEWILMSCLGLVVTYLFSLLPKKNVMGLVIGLLLLFLPILSTFKQEGLNMENLSKKRDEGIKVLLSSNEKGRKKFPSLDQLDLQSYSVNKKGK